MCSAHPPFSIIFFYLVPFYYVFSSTPMFYFFCCSRPRLLKYILGEKSTSLAEREMAPAGDSALVLNVRKVIALEWHVRPLRYTYRPTEKRGIGQAKNAGSSVSQTVWSRILLNSRNSFRDGQTSPKSPRAPVRCQNWGENQGTWS